MEESLAVTLLWDDDHSAADTPLPGTAVQAGGSPFYLTVLNTYLVPVLFSLISVLGVAGNSLVVYVILANERMRTVTNLLLLNLAVADVSFVLVIPPFTAHQMASSSWPFGDYACRLMHYLVNVTAYVTVYTLVLISVIRYVTVVHSVRTAGARSRRNVVTMIVTIWAVMLVVNSPVLTSYGVRTYEDHGGVEECDIVDHRVGQGLFAAFFVFAYLLPLGVIAAFSLAILRHIHRHRSPSVAAAKNRSSARKKKRQVGRTLILVVVVFALSWMPVHVHILVFFFGRLPEESGFYSAVSVLWYCLAYFNSCVNPIIYNHTSKEFRDAFRQVVCRGRRRGGRRPSPLLPRASPGAPLRRRSTAAGALPRDREEELLPVPTQRDSNE